MIATGHDAKWWQQFTLAPPELQRAMHSTLRARDALELRIELGVDDDSELVEYEQCLKERELAEHRLREDLQQRRSAPPAPRKVPSPRKSAPEADQPPAPGPDHYW
jgi:hypothetical protein